VRVRVRVRLFVLAVSRGDPARLTVANRAPVLARVCAHAQHAGAVV